MLVTLALVLAVTANPDPRSTAGGISGRVLDIQGALEARAGR
jgi:hypothetical protein